MPKPLPLTEQTINDFYEYAQTQLQKQTPGTLTACVERFTEIVSLEQEIKELQQLPEAAAGCGFSREEILAQYEDKLRQLREA